MSGFRPVPDSEFWLGARYYRVHSYDWRRGCVTVADTDAVLTTFAIDDLVHHPELSIPDEKVAPVEQFSAFPEEVRNVALRRIEHISEAMTGYRSGDPNQARPNEPRPAYDPATVCQRDRLTAKAAELDNEFAREFGVSMSDRTMRRLWRDIKAGRALAAVAGAQASRRSYGRRGIHPELVEPTTLLIADQRHTSSKSVAGLFVELRGRMLKSHGQAWIEKEFPSERTWRRYVADRWTPSEVNGKARTRGSATTAPKGGFVRTNPVRPGQMVQMDTNSLDVLLKGTVLEGAIRGSVVVAIDAYSRSICALRVVEQAEKNVDVTLTLLDVARPKQMLPGWPAEARWPFVGIPESVLIDTTGPTSYPNGVSGMPLVNVEALVTDNGATYRAHKTRQLCCFYDIDLLPARTYTGSDKPFAERIFGAMNTMLLQHLKGYRGSDTAERGKNTDAEVEWTAQRLEDLLSLWVVMIWQTHVMDDVKPAWCPEGDWSPNALFNHGVETTGLAPRLLTASDYYRALTTTTVKVHSRGVKAQGLWFDLPFLDEYRNKPSPAATNKWSVQYDKRDMRYVYFVDEHGERHPLPWVGATGEFPAFSDRHIKALRKRVGERLDKFTADHLAEVLLTQVLPARDAEGWFVGEESANAAASKHARDVQLANADAAKYGAEKAPPVVEPDDAMEQKRRERREAASAAAAAAAAADPTEMRQDDQPPATTTNEPWKGTGGMFGDLQQLREEDPA